MSSQEPIPIAFTQTSQPADLSQGSFVTLILAITIGWVLIALWTRFVNNFTFDFLGLNSDSPWHSFIAAIGWTAFFVLVVYIINQYNIVPGVEQDFLNAADFPPGSNALTGPGQNIVVGSNINTNSASRSTSQLQVNMRKFIRQQKRIDKQNEMKNNILKWKK